jgi:hypothetical protein
MVTVLAQLVQELAPRGRKVWGRPADDTQRIQMGSPSETDALV